MRLMPLFSLLLAVPLATLAAEPNSDRTAIEDVVEQFRASIIEKDKEKFLETFLHNRVTWQAATSTERHAAELQSDPGARRVSYRPEDTPEAFIDGIVNSPSEIEETFSGVTIDTDGMVASVAFNFEFLRNGEAINTGREYWLLVQTGTGWKIAAVTWSRNTP
ncbi:hypothetical protein H4F99_00425 [Lysobacter sp. SG-8]|uniref:Nuclear transport factor 2 family protein n=1 Tax=Marilutibacter penaei TaxID=2759900 RepID=A0A7W3U0Z3_9GAMM|nr:hypothetical protein [Lysobacter penaei]MBB1086946.1 hypothetical protein [Lysobacter penaei]